MQKGTIGVTTENIFPIIKKFLYSDHEIFLRELISNAVDATTKLKALNSMGEFKGELGDLTIHVELDEKAKKLTVSDRGIGMTEEEVNKYINQIAFSGAEEFMKKYENQSGIIGHFGLGFYSAFMVASKVEVITRSYRDGAQAVKWSCDGTPDFTLETAEKSDRGTDIILYLSDDSAEFAEKSRIESLLKKYCSFLPVPIAFGKEQKWEDGKYVDTDKDNIVNDTHPLWMQKPTDITEEQYTEFYHKLYPMAEDPLFHIHLNVDYPFTLTGILYFPKIKNNFEIQKNKIQLYSNQVYVTDSVEGIVPDFLTLLHGVIDSPDIPLNVSRSYLQSDSNVKKISGYITKKVADRLADLFKNSRSEYETKWDDLKLFIQYGIVSEEKFGDRAAEFTLLKNTEGKYFTFDEYTELIKGNQTDKNGKLIHLYSNDPVTQNSFIESARAKGYDVLVMDSPLEAHFISFLENKHSDWRFTRVDSDTVEKLIEKEEQLAMALTSAQQKLLTPVFESQLPTDPKSRYHVQFEAMDPASSPIIITQGEFMRRMKDMSKVGGGMYSFYGEMPDSYNVVVNGNHPLVIEVLGQTQNATGEALAPLDKELEAAENEKTALSELLKDKKEEEISQEEKDKRAAIETKIGDIEGQRNELLRKAGSENVIVGQLVDLALLANGMLKGEALTRFIKRSVEVVGKSAEKAN
ncbi:molecular chaperone HtpG [Millionella massiliensis]|uniref:molecular chaperone HtpG n=1 Tax=Millionella massiliensis TaxID=1871023 RepID=UPI0008DAE279|nr:molecular chaperone HtpG [Millionella massiliensis]